MQRSISRGGAAPFGRERSVKVRPVMVMREPHESTWDHSASPRRRDRGHGTIAALVLVWSAEEPGRVGEVACLPPGVEGPFTLGRAVEPGEDGALPLVFTRLRPFERTVTGPLRAARISRWQIRVGPLADSSLTARRLGVVRLVVVASPRLRPLPKAPAGLVSCPCVATSADERWSVRGEWLRIRARLVVNDLDAALEACLLGSGVARLPDRLVEPALRSGALVELFAERVATNFAPVHALVPSGRFQPAKVRVFLDALEAARGDGLADRADADLLGPGHGLEVREAEPGDEREEREQDDERGGAGCRGCRARMHTQVRTSQGSYMRQMGSHTSSPARTSSHRRSLDRYGA